MSRNSTLKTFYASQAWIKLRLVLIAERGPICQQCGKLISNPLDLMGIIHLLNLLWRMSTTQ
jgi:hypothetical protein